MNILFNQILSGPELRPVRVDGGGEGKNLNIRSSAFAMQYIFRIAIHKVYLCIRFKFTWESYKKKFFAHWRVFFNPNENEGGMQRPGIFFYN